jgi:hypothetical protein
VQLVAQVANVIAVELVPISTTRIKRLAGIQYTLFSPVLGWKTGFVPDQSTTSPCIWVLVDRVFKAVFFVNKLPTASLLQPKKQISSWW